MPDQVALSYSKFDHIVDSDDEDVVVSSLASLPAAAATLAAMQQGA